MTKLNSSRITVCLLIILSLFSCTRQNNGKETIPEYINKAYGTGNIPGMSVVLVADGKSTIYNLGYSNIEEKKKVGDQTLFQLGSCSKAFTALAVNRLVEEGFIRLDTTVSSYISWFKVQYKSNPVDITIRQLLNQTSGIPWNTIAKIPRTNERDALEQTVKSIAGIELHRYPGKQFEYATVNYDILALVVEKVSKQPFENYVQQHILSPLRLNYTSVGAPLDSGIMSTGYKIGFFKPRKYTAPVYRGNNAAGYVISNAMDMAKWLRYQIGIDSSSLTASIYKTHQRDETVPPIDNRWYASGWFESLNGDNTIYHTGLNPNFTSFVGFNPKGKYGVVVLANSNSPYTEIIGQNLLRLLSGSEVQQNNIPGDNTDRVFSTVSLILGFYILVCIFFIGYVIFNVIKKNRIQEGLNLLKVGQVLLAVVALIPFLYGLYKLPGAMAGFTWDAMLVWMPLSFQIMLISLLAALIISLFAYLLTLYFPDSNKQRGSLPKLLLISALSGVSNMLLILLVTSALHTSMEMKFLIYYFVLVLSVYMMGRRFVQIKLIKLTRDLIYDLRLKLIERIFNTSYQKFEKIDRGRIYTALNDDVGTIGESINMFIMLVTHTFTAGAALIYLATIAFWATSLTVLLLLTLSTIYYFVSRTTHHYFEEARDTRNVFMRLLNGMIDGFKEISLHQNKKMLYKEDISKNADEYRHRISIASIRYVKASLLGEIVLVSILGTAVFAFPVLFPYIQLAEISMFVIVLLYLIGPVNGILQSIPAIKRLTIAWKRVQQFTNEIPANYQLNSVRPTLKANTINSLKVENLKFSYDNEGDHRFDVGPINLEVKKGEILFVIGGNGSGKTTLAKLLTGLYEPDDGKIHIDEEEVSLSWLGENFSAVFNPLYLFEKLYNIDISEKAAEISRYLGLLDLTEKVQVLDNGTFSTINLSGGQRKRLALLLCYLEDSPIYLFDEWAADQDPEYRKFFYRTLLPEMARKGKIVIAITHDDHYFDIADKVLKMNQGKLEVYSRKENFVMKPQII